MAEGVIRRPKKNAHLDRYIASLQSKEKEKKERKVDDLTRISKIPVFMRKSPDLTKHFRKPGGTYSLYPIQNQALYEAHKAGGLLGLIGVGEGKTLITQLLPTLFGSKRPLLLLPAAMVEQYYAMLEEFESHFYVAKHTTVLSYSKLSIISGQTVLQELQPDLIIGDEAHYLRNKDSARTRRLIEYLKTFPDTKTAWLSGTLSSRSIVDYEHLSRFALGDNSPIPFDYLQLQSWANVIDSDGTPSKFDFAKYGKFFYRVTKPEHKLNQENARKVFRYRLITTPGVVSSTKGKLGTTLVLHKIENLAVPSSVRKHLDTLKKTWVTPDGDEVQDPMHYARVERQIVQGFYYIWDWGPEGPNVGWLKARSRWNKAVRDVLAQHKKGLDSVLAISNAIERGKLEGEVAAAYQQWKQWKHFDRPPTKPVWFSPYLIQAAVNWAKAQKEPVILWYDSLAVEQALEYMKIPVYGANSEIPAKNATTLAASIRVHGTGKNLQAWSNQLLISPLSSGAKWEQLLGRTHRTGQQADEVHFSMFHHLEAYQKAMTTAVRDARYLRDSQGNPQKLLYGNWVTEKGA